MQAFACQWHMKLIRYAELIHEDQQWVNRDWEADHMLENLRKMDRLSEEEERRIDNKIRIVIIAVAAVVVAFIIWRGIKGASLGPGYYAVMIALLALVWIAQNVVATVMKHALAGRTDEQVSAYLKAAGFDFVSYAGLAWFLIGMNSSSIIGIAIYVVGVTGARRQRDIYFGDTDTEDSDSESSAQDGDSSPDDGAKSPSEEQQPLTIDALPTAADREQREKEAEDGSV